MAFSVLLSPGSSRPGYTFQPVISLRPIPQANESESRYRAKAPNSRTVLDGALIQDKRRTGFLPLASHRSRTYIQGMNSIALRPSLLIERWLVLLGLLPALVIALAVLIWLFEASRDCRGSLSAGFSNGFDLYRCDLVVRKIGSDLKIRVPLPQ
jgi:hypothetical protein